MNATEREQIAALHDRWPAGVTQPEAEAVVIAWNEGKSQAEAAAAVFGTSAHRRRVTQVLAMVRTNTEIALRRYEPAHEPKAARERIETAAWWQEDSRYARARRWYVSRAKDVKDLASALHTTRATISAKIAEEGWDADRAAYQGGPIVDKQLPNAGIMRYRAETHRDFIERAVAKEPVAAPETSKPFWQKGQHECGWIFSDPGPGNMDSAVTCCAPIRMITDAQGRERPESPYCPKHTRAAYQPHKATVKELARSLRKYA